MTKTDKIKNGIQMKLIFLIKEFSLKHKWYETIECMNLLNKHLTRHYINIYWKLIFQLGKCKLKLSPSVMPQFIDCLKTFKLSTFNQILYSYIVILLSENKYELANDLLKLIQFSYTQTDNLTPLITSLKGIIDYIQWKAIINDSERVENEKEFAEQLAERCIFQFRDLIINFDIADIQLIKISEILLYYDKISDLNDLLKEYVKKNSNYVNAYKYYYKFQQCYEPKNTIHTLQKIVQLVPSDSLVFDYCNELYKINDFITCIDCIFDTLDYSQWKNDSLRWNFFQDVLLNVKRDIDIKDCINGNWKIRNTYWPFFHFRKYEVNDLNNIKAIIAAILLGPQHKFVKTAKKYSNNIDRTKLINALEIHHWLIKTEK